MKLMITGYARHGKDTVAEYISQKYNLRYTSSSRFMCSNVVYPKLKEIYKYQSEEECWQDRMQHRKEWYDLISQYSDGDHSRLAREIFETNDIYCGIRNKREFHAAKNTGLFDFSIWVDRSDLAMPEHKESNSIEPWMVDFVIDNNDSLEQLHRNTDALMNHLTQYYPSNFNEVNWIEDQEINTKIL